MIDLDKYRSYLEEAKTGWRDYTNDQGNNFIVGQVHPCNIIAIALEVLEELQTLRK